MTTAVRFEVRTSPDGLVWDVVAARRAGIRAIGVLSGGFAEAELSEAGAIEVYESVMELHGRIDESALSG